MNEELNKAKALFEFVLSSDDVIGDTELFRHEMEAAINSLNQEDMIELGTFVFNTLLPDNPIVVQVLINALTLRL